MELFRNDDFSFSYFAIRKLIDQKIQLIIKYPVTSLLIFQLDQMPNNGSYKLEVIRPLPFQKRQKKNKVQPQIEEHWKKKSFKLVYRILTWPKVVIFEFSYIFLIDNGSLAESLILLPNPLI